jgi:hypothetical protein
MEGMEVTAETLCLSAMQVAAISVPFGGASTSGLGVGRVAKGPIGMGLGGRSS